MLLASACQPATPGGAPTQAPDPLVFSGQGSARVMLGPWQGPAVLKITAGAGEGTFRAAFNEGLEVRSFSAQAGPAEGYLGVVFGDSQELELNITGSQSWQVEVLPVAAPVFTALQIPGQYDGDGNALILLEGKHGLARFDLDQAEQFEAWAYGPDGVAEKLHITAEGDYKGNSVLPQGAGWIVINASGPWSVKILEPCCEKLW